MIKAHHRKTVEGQIFDKSAERFFDRIKCFEMIEMLRINIGHDGDIRGQFQKCAVRLIGFDHHPFAIAKTRIGAIGIDDAAIDHGRIELARNKKSGHKRCCRCFTMRAGNRDAGFKPHQFRKHFCAPHNRNAPLTCRHQFRIITLDRRRNNEHFRIAHVTRIMTNENGDTFIA